MKKSCLFLDRDGVINKKIPGAYVTHPSEFVFLPGAQNAIAALRSYFSRIVVVTNQQGIGKGLMLESDLKKVHDFMIAGLTEYGGSLDGIYFCPELAGPDNHCRKPNIGMALQAFEEFPDIRFKESVIVGDSPSDMEMGYRCGMHTVRIISHNEYKSKDFGKFPPHESCASLEEWASSLKKDL